MGVYAPWVRPLAPNCLSTHPPASLMGIPESPDCFDLHTALSYPGLNRDPCVPASLEMKPKLLEVPVSSLRGKQGG